MSDQADTRLDRARLLWWFTVATMFVVIVTLLVAGLIVPGFLLDRSESSALPDAPDSETPTEATREPPWAQGHLDRQNLTPDAAVGVLARQFVTRLNSGHVPGAVEMVCPLERRPIRDAVVWTARHRADLQIVTPLEHAARPGYATIRFAGAIEGRPRRGSFGIDADSNGFPRCVSAFYSVG